jgi:hypothetical protein
MSVDPSGESSDGRHRIRDWPEPSGNDLLKGSPLELPVSQKNADRHHHEEIQIDGNH